MDLYMHSMALILPKHKMLLAVLILKLPDPKRLPCAVLCMGRLRPVLSCAWGGFALCCAVYGEASQAPVKVADREPRR